MTVSARIQWCHKHHKPLQLKMLYGYAIHECPECVSEMRTWILDGMAAQAAQIEIPPPIPLEAIIGPYEELKVNMPLETLEKLRLIADECLTGVNEILIDAAEQIVRKYHDP